MCFLTFFSFIMKVPYIFSEGSGGSLMFSDEPHTPRGRDQMTVITDWERAPLLASSLAAALCGTLSYDSVTLRRRSASPPRINEIEPTVSVLFSSRFFQLRQIKLTLMIKRKKKQRLRWIFRPAAAAVVNTRRGRVATSESISGAID